MKKKLKLTYKPIEDTLTVKEKDGRFIAYYLTEDNYPAPPENDNERFLVHYHRRFYVTYESVVSEKEIRQWWNGEKIPQEENYWIFPLISYIHSGVYLYLGKQSNPTGGEFDTCHCGAIFISKAIWKRRKKAHMFASSLVEEWNCYLTGDVYGVVVEEFDAEGERIKEDGYFGYCRTYGYEYAIEELEYMMRED